MTKTRVMFVTVMSITITLTDGARIRTPDRQYHSRGRTQPARPAPREQIRAPSGRFRLPWTRHRRPTRAQGANPRTLDADCPVQEGTGRTQPTPKAQNRTPSTQIGLPTMVPQALPHTEGARIRTLGAKQISQDRGQPT